MDFRNAVFSLDATSFNVLPSTIRTKPKEIYLLFTLTYKDKFGYISSTEHFKAISTELQKKLIKTSTICLSAPPRCARQRVSFRNFHRKKGDSVVIRSLRLVQRLRLPDECMCFASPSEFLRFLAR